MRSSFLRGVPATLLVTAFLTCVALPAFAVNRPVVHRVPPVYPQIAKMMHVQGVVQVEVTVAADGKVTQVKAVGGNKMLEPAAEYAIRRWRFATEAAPSVENINIDFDDND